MIKRAYLLLQEKVGVAEAFKKCFNGTPSF